jgi:hypothetical protein
MLYSLYYFLSQYVNELSIESKVSKVERHL